MRGNCRTEAIGRFRPLRLYIPKKSCAVQSNSGVSKKTATPSGFSLLGFEAVVVNRRDCVCRKAFWICQSFNRINARVDIRIAVNEIKIHTGIIQYS